MIELGKIIRHYRIKNNLFQKDAAKMWGVSKAQLCKIEQGAHEPSGELTLKILTTLVPSLENDLTFLDIEQETNNRKMTHQYPGYKLGHRRRFKYGKKEEN